jgi:hypothetical protein
MQESECGLKPKTVPCPTFEWIKDRSTCLHCLHPADFPKLIKYLDAKLLGVPSLHFKCVTEEELQ